MYLLLFWDNFLSVFHEMKRLLCVLSLLETIRTDGFAHTQRIPKALPDCPDRSTPVTLSIHRSEVHQMKTWTRRYLISIIPALFVSTGAYAQDWAPNKQVTIVAPAGAGGGLDMVARPMA